MSKRRNYQGREAFHRMNYLYQISELCRQMKSSKERFKLMMHYGGQIKSVGRKGQCRMEPELKRTLCKGCSSLLAPGDTASVRLTKKPNPNIVWICLICGTYKMFGTRPNYCIWPEREESSVEIIKSNHEVLVEQNKEKRELIEKETRKNNCDCNKLEN